MIVSVLILVLGVADGAHGPVSGLVRPRGLRHDAGLSGGQEVPRRGHDPQLQGQVPAFQGQQERAALVSQPPHVTTPGPGQAI